MYKLAVGSRPGEGPRGHGGECGRARETEERRGKTKPRERGKARNGRCIQIFLFLHVSVCVVVFSRCKFIYYVIVDVYVCWRGEAAKKAGERENRGTQHGQENGGAVFEKRALMR